MTAGEPGMLHTLAELAVLGDVCCEAVRWHRVAMEGGAADAEDDGAFTAEEAAAVLQLREGDADAVRAVLQQQEDARLLRRVDEARWAVPPLVAQSMRPLMDQQLVVPERADTAERWAALHLQRFGALAAEWQAGRDLLGVLERVDGDATRFEYVLGALEIGPGLLVPVLESVWDAPSLMRARFVHVWGALFERVLVAVDRALARHGKRKDDAASPSLGLLHELRALCLVRRGHADAALDALGLVQQPTVRSQRLHVQALVLRGAHIDSSAPMTDAGHDLRREHALPAYQAALRIAHQLGESAHGEGATVLLQLSRLYRHLGDLAKASDVAKKGLAVRERLQTQSHPDTAAAMVDLAAVQMLQDDHEGANENYVRALAIYERVLGRNHVETAGTAVDMGLMFVKLGEPDNALDAFQYALPIYERNGYYGDVQGVCMNCARLLEAEEKDAEAITYYLRARDACVKQHGDTDSRVGMIYYNIGLAFARQSDWPLALQHLSKAHEIVVATLGPQHEYFQRIDLALRKAHEDARTSASPAQAGACVVQ